MIGPKIEDRDQPDRYHAEDDEMKNLNDENSVRTLEELRLLARRKYCGARTRKGTPCKRVDIYNGGRCRLHGGFSTGPKTEEGKRRSALNGHCPKRTP